MASPATPQREQAAYEAYMKACEARQRATREHNEAVTAAMLEHQPAVADRELLGQTRRKLQTLKDSDPILFGAIVEPQADKLKL